MHDCLNKTLIAKQILKHLKLFCRILGNIKINPTVRLCCISNSLEASENHRFFDVFRRSRMKH